MKCPACNSSGHRVIETRSTENSVRRRRSCQCGHEWSTWEWNVAEHAMLAVVRAFKAVEEAAVAFRDPPVATEPAAPSQSVTAAPAPRRDTYVLNGITLPRLSGSYQQSHPG